MDLNVTPLEIETRASNNVIRADDIDQKPDCGADAQSALVFDRAPNQTSVIERHVL